MWLRPRSKSKPGKRTKTQSTELSLHQEHVVRFKSTRPILLVEFLKLRAREGHAIPEAAKMASRERFRAILLTSLTTVAGLTPLLTEKSLQAQVLIPLATSIVFGLVVATTFVLFVVPALFSIFSDFGWVSMQKEIEMEKGT